MTQMVTVQVSVPEDRLSEFHEMFGRWLRRADPYGHGPAEESTFGGSLTEVRRGEAWRVGNADEVLRDALCLYSALSTLARRILDYWLDSDTRRHRAEDMARALDLESPRVIAGSLSSFGRNNRRCGARGLPFHWTEDENGAIYWMDDDVLTLFRKAREEYNR
jgi:hypothetical protein